MCLIIHVFIYIYEYVYIYICIYVHMPPKMREIALWPSTNLSRNRTLAVHELVDICMYTYMCICTYATQDARNRILAVHELVDFPNFRIGR